MKKIVLVVGQSAVGKETFIKKVCAGNLDIILNLGWQNFNIVHSKSSIEILKNIKDKNRFAQILEDINILDIDNNIILIKFQLVDLEENCFVKIKELFPNSEHLIVYLSATKVQICSRLTSKEWWSEKEIGTDFLDTEKEIFNNQILNKEIYFHKIKVDSDDNFNYRIQ